VVAAAQQLTIALQGNIPAGNETVEALQKVSKPFTKIATAKNEAAKAKANCNKVHATQVARQTLHLPRVEGLIPRVEAPISRVTINLGVNSTSTTPMNADC
jgi:hypothetical protein